MNNQDCEKLTVEISLPRHVACWLLVHCDKALKHLGYVLPHLDSDDSRELCLSEMKLFNTVYGRLIDFISEREI